MKHSTSLIIGTDSKVLLPPFFSSMSTTRNLRHVDNAESSPCRQHGIFVILFVLFPINFGSIETLRICEDYFISSENKIDCILVAAWFIMMLAVSLATFALCHACHADTILFRRGLLGPELVPRRNVPQVTGTGTIHKDLNLIDFSDQRSKRRDVFL